MILQTAMHSVSSFVQAKTRLPTCGPQRTKAVMTKSTIDQQAAIIGSKIAGLTWREKDSGEFESERRRDFATRAPAKWREKNCPPHAARRRSSLTNASAGGEGASPRC
jgi:hypothetical protein